MITKLQNGCGIPHLESGFGCWASSWQAQRPCYRTKEKPGAYWLNHPVGEGHSPHSLHLSEGLPPKTLKSFPPPPSLPSYLISKAQSSIHKPMLTIMLSCCETTICSMFRDPHCKHTHWFLGLALASPLTALEKEKYFVWLSPWWLHVDSLCFARVVRRGMSCLHASTRLST